MRIPETSVAFSRPLRAVALLVALSAAGWELAARHAGTSTALWLARIVEVAIALGVAAASTPRRSPTALRALAFTLAMAMSMANVTVASFVPARVWEAMSVQGGVIMGAAL